jgi:hypothetical protein
MEWIAQMTDGLRMLFERAKTAEEMGKAIDAYLEVARLTLEIRR